jgi:hypothetical protein
MISPTTSLSFALELSTALRLSVSCRSSFQQGLTSQSLTCATGESSRHDWKWIGRFSFCYKKCSRSPPPPSVWGRGARTLWGPLGRAGPSRWTSSSELVPPTQLVSTGTDQVPETSSSSALKNTGPQAMTQKLDNPNCFTTSEPHTIQAAEKVPLFISLTSLYVAFGPTCWLHR